MRFKTIFVIFNLVIILCFLTVFFMPLLLMGREQFSIFFDKNWYVGCLFLTALGGFNIYFLGNWKLFQYLEKEDWIALNDYLEKKIFSDKRLRNNYVRLLINSYLVTTNIEGIARLQTFLDGKGSHLVKRFALQFGIPFLIRKKPEEAEKYFGRLLSQKRVTGIHWIRWNYAFSLMQLKQFEGAKKEFLEITNGTKEPVLLVLSLYILDSFHELPVSTKVDLEKRIEELKKRFTPSGLEKQIDREKGKMHVVVLSKIIDEAAAWLFQYESISKNRTMH